MMEGEKERESATSAGINNHELFFQARYVMQKSQEFVISNFEKDNIVS